MTSAARSACPALVEQTTALADVCVPTLALHASHVPVVPASDGCVLASRPPGAEFVEFDTRHHGLLAQPAGTRFQTTVLNFAQPGAGAGAVQSPRGGNAA